MRRLSRISLIAPVVVLAITLGNRARAQACSDDVDCATPCTQTAVCNNGTCETTPKVCDDSNACTSDSCDPQNGNCVFDNQPNGTSCADGNVCNGDETCVGGNCRGGTELQCDDGNPCTVDSCSPTGGCQATAIPGCCTSNAECGDTNLCTSNERCVNNACVSDAVNCSDGNICTDDTCNPATGCAHSPLPNGTTCGDGNFCTGTQTCQSGTCFNPGPPNCDDGNACTTDGCDQIGGCTHAPIAGCCTNDAQCADTDACTINERCVNNACVHDTLGCDDNNVCTSDSCNPASGCVFSSVPNGQACPDGNPCNGANTCQGGQCVDGTPPSCDDSNVCTTDSCVPFVGCQHAGIGGCCNIDVDCFDTDFCTVNERCVSHTCTSQAKNCNDGNPCTADTCDHTSGCINAAVLDGTSCSDNQACDGVETCAGGTCRPGTPPNCDDGNGCTADSCNNASGCQNAPIAGCCNTDAQCADANLCTTNEHCTLAHTCTSSPVSCDDANQCTIDSCNPSNGCFHVAQSSTTCNDGNACTLSDTCLGGACTGTPKACSDGNLCNGSETCQGGGSCSTPSSLLVCTPGSKRDTTCGAEWFADVPNNPLGPMVTKQDCIEGDPTCDHDTSASTCTFEVGICFRVSDPRLLRPCTPTNVSGYTLLKPDKNKNATETNALEGVLLAIPGSRRADLATSKYLTILFSPELSSTRCTSVVSIPVPVNGKFKLRGRATTGFGIDSDSLLLRCRASG